jgi:hypothetical protein
MRRFLRHARSSPYELSLLGSEHAVEEKLAHRYEKASALADDRTVPRTTYRAIGEAKARLVGGLMSVGALAAAGAIVPQAARLRQPSPQRRWRAGHSTTVYCCGSVPGHWNWKLDFNRHNRDWTTDAT